MIPPPLPPDEPRRLLALRRLGLLDTPAEERFDRIVRMAARMFRVPITLVSLVDESRQWFKARVGLSVPSTERSVSFCGHAILKPDTFVVKDALEDRRFADNPLVTGEPRVRFYLPRLVHEEDRATTAAWLERGARGEPLPCFEHRCRARDGSWHWLQWNATVNPDEGILYGVARDVTEQKRLEAERRHVERMKSEFVSTVSHELRTPLTSIRGALGLLSGGVAGPLPAEAADMIGIAHKNSERLIRLINDILDMEKMESGKLDFHIEPQELGAMLSQAAKAHHGYAQECGARVELEVRAADAWAMVDGDRFLQVLANLLSNALKFSPRGERVTLRLERMDGRLRVSVQDRGPGIPEAFRERIFEKFAQADGSDTRRKGGTGLGLSIARGLVERMGGSLDFVTTASAGTTFHVELPECHPLPPPYPETP